jgi:glycosyltransferase involved in cell wall biosynthesis
VLRVAYDVTISARASTGVGVYARALRAALATRPIDIRDWQYPLGEPGRPVTRLANGARLARWFCDEVDRRARREAVAVYHSTTSLGPLRARGPVVMTVHDATTLTMPLNTGVATRAFLRLFSVVAARRADAVIAPSRAAAAAIADEYRIPSSRIRVMPLGVDPRFRSVTADDVARVRRGFGLKHPYVLFVGAEVPRKNVARLVEAFALIADAFPDVHLVLAGPANFRSAAVNARIDQFRLGDRVRRLNEVPREDLPALYAGSACLAHVALCEGFGLPVAEAMAAGTPVVTSNCSSMPEVAGDAAICVDPLSVEDIAQGLSRMLRDSAVADTCRTRGRARSLMFDWSTTAQQTETLYREISGQ